MPLKNAVAALVAVVLIAVLPVCATPQQPNSDAYRMQASRPELVATLGRLRELSRSPSPPTWVSTETTVVRARLDEGDFRVGDRVLLAVEDPGVFVGRDERSAQVGKSQEQQLCDTFTVGMGQELLLPVVGKVSLRGVLRSEVESVLARTIGGYIKDPVIHARSLVTLGVTGEVGRPGYYSMSPDAILPAVLTAASGPTKDAKMNKLRLERDGKAFLEGKALRRAMEQGATLDALQVRSGDHLVVPSRTHGDLYEPLRFIAVLLGIPVTVYTLTHLH